MKYKICLLRYCHPLLLRLAIVLLASGVPLATPAGAFAAPPEVKIVAIGDSGIRGRGVPQSEAYPAQLEAALNARGHDVTVINQGVDGDTTQGVLQRLDRDVPAGTDIVVLKVGVNDIVLHHLSRQYVEANTRKIVARLRARGIAVYRLVKMQQGLVNRADLHVEPFRIANTTMWHLNAAGYAIVVRRTLPTIEALVKKAEKRKERMH